MDGQDYNNKTTTMSTVTTDCMTMTNDKECIATSATSNAVDPLSFKNMFDRQLSMLPTTTSSSSSNNLVTNYSGFSFLPDFTEHPKPKPKRRPTVETQMPVFTPPITTTTTTGASSSDNEDETDVSFWHDFLAGGAAGSASVIVGHPFDTIKVRMQTSNGAIAFNGLFRGMAAPLSAATAINALVFSSYGMASRFYDQVIPSNNFNSIDDDDDITNTTNHDPWQKAWACGSFAGLMQCFIICPMEHVKCRLQVGSKKLYKGPLQACKHIVNNHGYSRLYQGWWTTLWREVPAFGLYFCVYDYLKDKANNYLAHQAGVDPTTSLPLLKHDITDTDFNNLGIPVPPPHSHTWLASAFAGGSAGCATWAVVYPIDVIKTRVQTSPLTTPKSELRILYLAQQIVQQHGYKYLFRGLGITLIRAFPVNGTIFPVYEFTLLQVTEWEKRRK